MSPEEFSSTTLLNVNAIVADGSRFGRQVLLDILSDGKIRFAHGVASGVALLNLATKSSPDLVVIDDALDWLTATEVLRILRAEMGEARVPASILISSCPTRSRVLEAREAGYQAVIRKPVSPEQLLGAARKLMTARMALKT